MVVEREEAKGGVMGVGMEVEAMVAATVGAKEAETVQRGGDETGQLHAWYAQLYAESCA